MKINIPIQPNTSIIYPIPLYIEDYTVFAGENNTGKSSLLEAIQKELEKKDFHVIFIPAERVIADAEIKVGAEKDPLRNALMGLVDVLFDVNSINSLVKNIEKDLPKEFLRYGVEKHEISVNTNLASQDDYIESIKETYVKKLIKSIMVEDSYVKIKNIKLSEVGQGTQRMVIVALLKYLGEKKKQKLGKVNKPTYIIFEEPEIYLHPKLKESLHKSLLDLSKSENVKIIISTHDPYFIELTKDQKIYKVYRDDKKGFSTQVDDKVDKEYVGYRSYAEINYKIFAIPSESYFLEIYEHTKRKFKIKNKLKRLDYWEFDNEMHNNYFKKNGVSQSCDDDTLPTPNKITPMTRIRHNLAHAKNELHGNMSLGVAIQKIIDFNKTI